MVVEYDSLMKNNTWNLVPLPLGKDLVGCKWIYKTKFIVEGHIEKYKEWLVTKGFLHK
jgi:histone deacetylase 1/2